MRKLSDTIARIVATRGTPLSTVSANDDRLVDITDFGADPGNLRARTYVPEQLAEHPALVVILHGCTQTAEAYDLGAGWSRLADELGFVLLFPEQRRANNANLCFNWFTAEDIARDQGEARSIRSMIETMVRRHAIDPQRVFVTGLSAGGAMSSVMLATYPEVFAGGAIIAGLPYGVATSVPQAFDRMRGSNMPQARELSALVRAASGHKGPWPTISIWHGTGDMTVNVSNADAIVDQWRTLHGVEATPTRSETVDGQPHRLWIDDGGRTVIEEYRIAGMAHGTPLATRGPDGCGVAGPYMLEASISSTRHIACFWGLDEGASQHRTAPAPQTEADSVAPATQEVRRMPALRVVRAERIPEADTATKPVAAGIGKVIEDALRSAGLMR